jgi:SPOR domain
MMAWGKRSSAAKYEWAPALATCTIAVICFATVSLHAQTNAPEAPAAQAGTAAPAPPAPAKKAKPKASAAEKAEAKAPKKDPTAIQQQIDAGAASVQAGKADVAVQQLTTVISGGGLTPAQLARAQYLRGLAYRKQGKPALAIGDLMQALYIKNGLVEPDRSDALANRSAAYRDAGLPDQEDAASTRTASNPAARTTTGSAPVPTPAATADSGSGGGLGGFFGNLFGGGGSSAPTPAAAPTPTPAKPDVATSGWNSNTEVKPAAPATPAKQQQRSDAVARKQTVQEASSIATGSVVRASAPAGQFALQVAQLKTREEAEAVAGRIKQQFAAELGGREASIMAVSQGGFGTVHRVTFGPFADASEWKQICPKLLGAKHDCQPIAR